MAHPIVLYSPALIASGGVAIACRVLWGRLSAEQVIVAPALWSRLQKAARLSSSMASHSSVVVDVFHQKQRLADAHRQVGGHDDLLLRPFRPFCCANWSPAVKLARIVDHAETVARFGGVMRPEMDEVRLMANLNSLGPDYTLKIDEPDWMMFDGLTVLSLWKGIDRLFSITFVLSEADGPVICYIGGLQGRQGDTIRDLYRDMTKEAHGLRPRDLMIELHRMVCRALGITQIHAIADDARYCRDRYYGADGQVTTSFNYDEAWSDRGGTRKDGDWFEMPLLPQRRADEEIPAKKRSLYRERYALLDRLEAEVATAVAQTVPSIVTLADRAPATPQIVLPMPIILPQVSSLN